METEEMLYTGEMLYNCLKDLIVIAHHSQNKIPTDVRSSISKKSWLKEFCTIALRCPRQSGHDYAIYKLIKNSPDKRFAIIAKTVEMKRNMRRRLNNVLDMEKSLEKIRYAESRSKEQIALDNQRILSFSSGNLDNIRGIRDVDYVIVNCASLMSTSKLEELYEILCGLNNTLVILVE
jgi:hypothetical protein